MKRHRFDPFSFVFGAVFLVVGATFLFGGSGLTAARPVRMWPASTIVVGVALAGWAVAHAIHRDPRSNAVEAIVADAGESGDVGPDATKSIAADGSEEQRSV